jgi:transcriptional regulator with XRE-family HTH domain
VSNRPLVDPDALRAARLRAGLTQHQLAVVLGISGAVRVSEWESRPHALAAPRLAGLAEALGVRPVDILQRPDGPDLRFLRVQAGMSVPQLAAAVGVSAPTVWRWENGERTRPRSRETLQRLARVLGCDVVEIEAAFSRAGRPPTIAV